MTGKLRRRERRENELQREGRKKERRLKSYVFVYGHFFEVSQRRFNTFFRHVFVYIKVSVCACVFILLALLCH